MEPVTLVSPNGGEVVVFSPTEANDLIFGQGYKTLSQVNDEAEAELETEDDE